MTTRTLPRAAQELSRETWGVSESRTYWVPPTYAGVQVKVDLFRGYLPNPVNLGPLHSKARNIHCCASRRGGKTNVLGRVSSLRSSQWTQRILLDQDPHFSPAQFRRWQADFIGTLGAPKRILAADARRSKWPVPCVALAPTLELVDLQKAELGEIWDPWADELGVIWLDGGRILAILGLGIRWTFLSAERGAMKVGTGNCILWAGEAARLRPGTWEHIRPTVFDRGGQILTDTTPWGGKNPIGYFGECWAHGDEDAAADLENPDLVDGETECFHWTADKNLAVPELAVQMEKDRVSYGESSAYFRRTWLASWDLPEGMCWPQFSTRRHVRRADYRDFDLWVAGYDHGFSEHPAALLIAGVTRARPGRPRCVHVFMAYYGTGILVTPSDGEAVEGSHTWKGFLLKSLKKIRHETGEDARLTLYGAHERPEATQAMAAPGISARQARYVSVDGIEDVERLLVDDPEIGGPRLTFDPTLPPSILRDMQGARWAKDSRGRSLPRFDKDAYDPHAADALVHFVQELRSVLDLFGGWRTARVW